MFGSASKPNSRIDSLIGAGTVIEGSVNFSGGLRVDGEIRGNVSVMGDKPGTLVLSEHARIDGEVNVPHLVINGTINGPVRSGDTLELQPHAKVTGDVEYNSIEIQLGAIVQGRLIHLGNSTKAVELKLAASH